MINLIYIPLILALVFLLLLFFGLFYLIRGAIYNIKLINYLKKNYPSMGSHLSIFNKKSFDPEIYIQSRNRLIKLLFAFGTKKSVEEFISIRIDVKKIRKLNDVLANEYLDKFILSMSWYFKLWILGMATIALAIVCSWLFMKYHYATPLEFVIN